MLDPSQKLGIPSSSSSQRGIDVTFLDNYARLQWEGILHYLVNSAGDSFQQGYQYPSTSVRHLLELGRLVGKKGRDPGSGITQAGFFGSPEWGRSWSKKYQKEFINYWSANYQNLAMTIDNPPRSSTAPQTLNGIFRQHWQSIGPNRVSSVVMNEAENYLRAPVIG